jgi:glycosyltransferase involved in cell wall biosynthesis
LVLVSAPRITVDLRIADALGAERTGVGRYAIESTRALVAARPDWHFRLLTNRPALFTGTSAVVELTRWPTHRPAARVAWLHTGPARFRRGTDAWFGTAFTLPVGWRGPSVVTIHDLFFLERRRQYHGRVNARYASLATRHAASIADAVVVGASATQARLQARLGVNPAKIAVVPYGVASRFRDAVHDPRGNYVLAVGTWEPRKGLELLCEMLDRLNATRIDPVRLVLAGRVGWGVERELITLRAHPLVEMRSDIDDDRLVGLYAGARALVYPSQEEGFGLPVVEAMAVGCPVVASDLPAIREFALDAPRYAKPGSPTDLARSLAAVLEPAEAGSRTRRGREVAARLSWEAHGIRVAQLIEASLR